MFVHEVASLVERITISHKGLCARVTVELDGTGFRPAFRYRVESDRGVLCDPPAPGGEWDTLACGGREARFKVRYTSDFDHVLPSLVLDAERDWGVSWETLVPHPVLEAAKLRKLERSRR